MRIGLTGATGFLGRYVLKGLVEAGHQVCCWHRPQSDRSGLEALQPAVEWMPGNLGDRKAMVALVRDRDAVVHVALQWEETGGMQSAGQGDLGAFLEANLMGSLRLFQTAFAASVSRFVFISSCSVHEVILEQRPLDETHPLWPTSHYGAHKAALEKFVHSYGLGQGWPICALRPTGIYGLAHPVHQSRWYDLVAQVLGNEPIASARGGKEVHADDVARAVQILLQADAKTIAGQVYNCCDRYVAEQEVAQIAKRLSGSSSRIAELNRGPKNQIVTEKLRALGMKFGGQDLLQQTIAQLVQAQRQ